MTVYFKLSATDMPHITVKLLFYQRMFCKKVLTSIIQINLLTLLNVRVSLFDEIYHNNPKKRSNSNTNRNSQVIICKEYRIYMKT